MTFESGKPYKESEAEFVGGYEHVMSLHFSSLGCICLMQIENLWPSVNLSLQVIVRLVHLDMHWLRVSHSSMRK